ncbi:hypothetical protein FRB96_004236 [Tulasnella sp. 330]|nr:hypothetical protein FRB96_004236 [Tulasnella sp. 330]KAG8875265.1 hypothetical protein FRB97_005318 [Tulasnella sp. 331]KAG8880199.1 hypothetical protein FRB98_005299 [Tulasnella sp. 332]
MALLERLKGRGSGGTMLEMPPPYTEGEQSEVEDDQCSKTALSSPAQIMAVNEYGQVLGDIGPTHPGASWFNFQPYGKALMLDVPVIDADTLQDLGSERSSEVTRLRMREVS